MIRIDCRSVSGATVEASDEVRAATDCFVRHGYAILDNVVPEETINALRREFVEAYAHFLRDETSDYSKKVGPSRYMIALRFAEGFGNPLIYANPVVIALVRSVIEKTAILEAYGAVVALPGAAAQTRHSDGPQLYGAEISA